MLQRAGKTVVLVNFLPSVSSTFAIKGSVFPSTAILLIGTVLKKRGLKVRIIDGGFHENYLDLLRECIAQNTGDIIWVGMSVMTTQVPLALEASMVVKEVCKQVPVVWGGPHPTLFPKQTLENENIDIIAINEGTTSAIRLTQALQSGEDLHSIAGLAYKNAGGETTMTPPTLADDLPSLPHFDFSLIEAENYIEPRKNASVYKREFPAFRQRMRIAPVLTGLGCPYKCQFCINVILQRRYRFREAESIVQEIKRLQAEYAVNTIVFLDEDFFVSRRRARELVSLLEQEKLHFNWRMWCRVDHLREGYIDRELLARLSKIGHGSLVMGGESGNQEVLDNLDKRITPDQILQSLQMLEGTRIKPTYSFMVGLENETLEQIRDTYRLCLKMKDIRSDVDIAGPFLFRLYPGSPIYDRLMAQYQLASPPTLEAWRGFLLRDESTYTNIPWMPQKFRKHRDRILFYYARATEIPFSAGGPRELWRALCSRVARYRVRCFCWHLPVGYWCAQGVRKAR